MTPGTLLGNYTVDRLLGTGGMSDVLLARSASGRLVVLKKPRSYDPDLAARLRDEGRLGARLYHPHLVETLDCFDHQGVPILVLGFVDGPTLDELRKRAPVPAAAVARAGCHVAEALSAVHDALGDDGKPLRAIHRDVTSRNIVVTPQGDAVLIDLGIARFDELRAARTETGMVIGTLRYMAPEIVDGEAPSQASDFYSLGCVLIEAATGQPVFNGPPSVVTAQIVGQGPLTAAVAAQLPEPLRAVVAKLVARRPADRFQHAHEISLALRSAETALGGGQGALAASVAAHGQAPPVEAAVTTGGLRVGEPNMAQTQTEGLPGAVPVVAPAAPHAPPRPEGTEPMAPSPWTTPTSPTLLSPVGGRAPAPPPSQGPIDQPPLAVMAPVFGAPPKAATPSFAPARRVEQPLELMVDVRAKSKVIEAPNDPRDWYPKHKRDWSWLTGGALKVVGVLVMLGGALLAWRWYDDEQRAADTRAIEDKVNADTALLQKALEDTPKDCSGDGAYWLYTDKRGRPVIVDAIGKIPKQYRAEARCVNPVR